MEQVSQWRIIREKYNSLSKSGYIVNIGSYKLTPLQKGLLQDNHNMIVNINRFNVYNHCNCCKRHYSKKPLDITDNRTPNNYPREDIRNLTGPVGGVEDNEVTDFFEQFKESTKPIIENFKHSESEDCQCNCRHLMRRIIYSYEGAVVLK
jgi:hypothetical protein